MKILQISPRLPFPLMDGGVISVYKLAESTSHLGEHITFVTYPERDPSVNAQAREAITPYMRLELAPRPVASRTVALMKTIARGAYPIERRMTKEMFALLDRLIRENTFDIVHVDHAHMGKYAVWIKEKFGLPVVLREHNFEALIYERYAKNTRNILERIVAGMHGRRVRKEEIKFISNLDATIPITREDEKIMREEVPNAWYEQIPAGVDTDYYKPQDVPTDPETIMWIGGMNWEPNKDAVHYFAEQIFPLILAIRPTARFEIAGVGTEKLQDLKHKFGDSVILHGRVPDIRPHVARATVMICPLRVGGGMRLKLLDFFAMGKAIVSTRIGAEGNTALDGEHILLRDTPQEFADAVLECMRSPELRKKLGVNARQLVESEYSWERIGKRFIELYRKVIERHRGNR